jgi:PRTRC genetic system protein E
MNTNFFKQIADLNITGNLQLAISKGAQNNLVVSVILQNEQCGDNAKKLIPPLLLKGTAEELDNGFFENIVKPIEQTSSLMLNMADYLKQQEEAQKQSAIEKDKTDKEKKAKEEKDKKFKEAMQKVDELEKEGKYKEAWVKLPDTSQFPDHAEIIRKRKSALAAKFSPDLFGVAETVAANEPQAGNTLLSEEQENEETLDEAEENWEEENEAVD